MRNLVNIPSVLKKSVVMVQNGLMCGTVHIKPETLSSIKGIEFLD